MQIIIQHYLTYVEVLIAGLGLGPDPVPDLGPDLGPDAETHDDPFVGGFCVCGCERVFGDHPVAPDLVLVLALDPVLGSVPDVWPWIRFWVCETPFVFVLPFVSVLVLVRSLYTNATKKFLKNP